MPNHYRVKEIYATLQGEGLHSGRAAVFVRFAGCNLWSGREEDRPTATCRFCDTDFLGGVAFTAAGLADAAFARWPGRWPHPPRPFAVLTGGEPALQVDGPLLAEFRGRGFEVAIETNGTRPLPPGIDHVCVSPKAGATLAVTSGDELKLVFPQPGAEPPLYEEMDFGRFTLQPMDGPCREANAAAAARYCLGHPIWRLGLQAHKIVGLR
jgi:7-carboxy-7-deazaguanine synthase